MKFYITKPIRTLLILIVSALMLTSCKKDKLITPTSNAIDPGEGAGGEVLTLTGSGLSRIQSIVFDLGNVPADVNPTLNTDNAMIFRVPAAANVGDQHIVFTNVGGYQFSVPFTVLAVPSLTSAFPTEWEAGSNVTINGNYLQTTDHVTIVGSTDTAIIVSATATQLVLKMPASDLNSAKITVHNNAGSTTSSFLLINMDEQLKFFTDDFASGMQNWSWCNASTSTDFAVSGSTSLKAIYSKDGWQGLSFHYDNVIDPAGYSYLSFWVKGGTIDNMVDVKPDGVVSGGAPGTTISVPAGVWTHITIPASGNFTGATFQRVNMQIHGPTGVDQTLYYDNVIFVK